LTVFSINPLEDARWAGFIDQHPQSSAFHQVGWLEALRRTYGYEPVVLTSTPPAQPLRDGLLLSRVSSWLTGSRLVSVPFADHCEPLLNDPRDYPEFAEWLRKEWTQRGYKYVELRPLTPLPDTCGMSPSGSYCFHVLDMKPGLEQIYRALHKDSVQRRIRKAERENLVYEKGSSEAMLREFYRLLLITRRRHQLPPQPKIWFKNLAECMAQNLQIRLAKKDGQTIAAILTLSHKKSIIYKYGCSDEKFHNLGGMPFIFWNMIQEGKASGIEELDFGRSDLDNEGLIMFKDKFGTTKQSLTYYRYSRGEAAPRAEGWKGQLVRRCFSILPDPVLTTAGRLLYRHIG
jgi:Acetyltransferase (GNAT) domain